MLFKPGKAVPVLRTDPCNQLSVHAHALPQTTDRLRLLNLFDSNGDSNSSSQRLPAATGDSA
jgi:hypothetical protein